MNFSGRDADTGRQYLIAPPFFVWYNRRRFSNLRPKNYVVILVEVAKDYSISEMVQ